MSDNPDKREQIKEASKQAIAKQPDEIHLIAAPQHSWSNPPAMETYARGLVDLEFSDVGTYRIDVLNTAVRTRFIKVFSAYPALQKAYLVFIRYDEAPEGSVALGLLSTTKEMALVDAIRKTFAGMFSPSQHLDIIFVAEKEVPRIEQVSTPFYTK